MSDIKHVYIIVEGPSDQLILGSILQGMFDERVRICFYVAFGVPGIISSTKPILDLVDENTKVIVVYDSDTGDELRAEERNDFVKSQILGGKKDERVTFVYFVPNIDQCHPFLAEYAQYKKKSRDKYNVAVQNFIQNNKGDFIKIKQIQRIIEFVRG